MNAQMPNTTHDSKKLWDIIADIKFAMFTARHGNGHIHSRPMTTQNTKNDRGAVLWFFMSHKSDSVADLRTDAEVNVTYADTGKDAYVSVSGRAHVVEDMGKRKELWNTMVAAWFPGGVTDPDLALVAVDITHADYWQAKDNQLVQILKMATSAVTGNPPRNMGEHGEIHMR